MFILKYRSSHFVVNHYSSVLGKITSEFNFNLKLQMLNGKIFEIQPLLADDNDDAGILLHKHNVPSIQICIRGT